MANGNIFAPQAYTREMLSQAFNWLQTQPESIRALASNPENLVALYFKAQRMQSLSASQKAQIESNTEAPVQSQSFLNELRSLADQMSAEVKTKTQIQTPPQTQVHTPIQPQVKSHVSLPNTQPSLNTQTKQMSNHTIMQSKPNITEVKSNSETPKVSMPLLNPQSLSMIQEVKEKLNLSSDQEAMNMLISIAHKSLKHLLD